MKNNRIYQIYNKPVIKKHVSKRCTTSSGRKLRFLLDNKVNGITERPKRIDNSFTKNYKNMLQNNSNFNKVFNNVNNES